MHPQVKNEGVQVEKMLFQECLEAHGSFWSLVEVPDSPGVNLGSPWPEKKEMPVSSQAWRVILGAE